MKCPRNTRALAEPSIAFVWGRLEGMGGTERRASEFIPRLTSLGIASESVTLGPADTPFGAYLNEVGEVLQSVRSPVQLARYLRHKRPRVVVAFGLRASMAVRLVKPILGFRLRLIDARNGLEFQRGRTMWQVDRLTQALVQVYMTNSEVAANKLADNGISRTRIKTNVSALGDEWLGRTAAERNPDRVLMVGNARPEKGHDTAVRAIARVSADVHLVLYTNDGTDVRALWDEVAPGPGKSLTVVEGEVVGPGEYAQATVLLHPSLSESLPRAILEAQSQGVRVVATRTGDTESILSANDYPVAVGDVDGIAIALESALADSRSRPYVHVHQRTVDDYCRDLLSICGVPSINTTGKTA
ncbi:glycosyltransferase family 4 protein [Pseudactinotalea terrae]|uniref:glycosyltransferase family 4 protein n=1 Tax=Pseudactinotalea terrae TaxID=1743262 RepID=UPI0012E18317|nr:glycosyltransferase family 4 protein [Pseudactinotalea terrae]